MGGTQEFQTQRIWAEGRVRAQQVTGDLFATPSGQNQRKRVRRVGWLGAIISWLVILVYLLNLLLP